MVTTCDAHCEPVRVQKTYFIHCPATGRVKIGKARDPQKRLCDLQTSASSPLRIIGVLDRDVEAELHRRFSHGRKHREWFDVCEAMAAFIREQFGAQIDLSASSSASDPLSVTLHAIRALVEPLGEWHSPGRPKDGNYDIDECFMGTEIVPEKMDQLMAHYIGEPDRSPKASVDYRALAGSEDLEGSASFSPDEAAEYAAEISEKWEDLWAHAEQFARLGMQSLYFDGSACWLVFVGSSKLVERAIIADAIDAAFWAYDEAGIQLCGLVVDNSTGVVHALNNSFPVLGKPGWDANTFEVVDLDAWMAAKIARRADGKAVA